MVAPLSLRALELELDGMSDTDLTLELARWQAFAMRSAVEVSTACYGVGELLTEKICRRVLADRPRAHRLDCEPETVSEPLIQEDPSGEDLSGRPVVVNPLREGAVTLCVSAIVDRMGNLVEPLPVGHPVHHWLRLVAPMVGAERVRLLLGSREWSFEAEAS